MIKTKLAGITNNCVDFLRWSNGDGTKECSSRGLRTMRSQYLAMGETKCGIVPGPSLSSLSFALNTNECERCVA